MLYRYAKFTLSVFSDNAQKWEKRNAILEVSDNTHSHVIAPPSKSACFCPLSNVQQSIGLGRELKLRDFM